MDKSESIKNIAIAMCKAQAEMGGAHKGANNPFFKSKYSNLSDVVQAVKEPFTNNGLSYVQFPIEDIGRIGVETILMHISGEWMSCPFTVNLAKQDAQGAGSAITYCRRYGLQAVAGIPSEDDDGNNASKKAPKKEAPELPKPLYEVYEIILATFNKGELQAVGDCFEAFLLKEEMVAVWNMFNSKQRAAIKKFTSSDQYTKTESLAKTKYLNDFQHSKFMKDFNLN